MKNTTLAGAFTGKIALPVAFLLFSIVLAAQPVVSEKDFVNRLNLSGDFPEDLLRTRTIVFHSYSCSEEELKTLQEYLQRTGIDAVGYFPMDVLMAGKDVSKGFYSFLVKREITNLLFAEKSSEGYRISITPFSKGEEIIKAGQPSWSVSNRLLREALKVLNRSALASLKKENLLINNVPEQGLSVNPITGKRNEFYAVDMKVDLVAVPKFGIDSLDHQLASIFEQHFPFEYKLVEPGVTEKEMRKQGMLYVLCFVYSRGEAVRELLGYPANKSESAYMSITYPGSEQQTKAIPASRMVFKAYFKHIDSGNVFLGNKWDADTSWQQALVNNIKAMKAELRLN